MRFSLPRHLFTAVTGLLFLAISLTFIDRARSEVDDPTCLSVTVGYPGKGQPTYKVRNDCSSDRHFFWRSTSCPGDICKEIVHPGSQWERTDKDNNYKEIEYRFCFQNEKAQKKSSLFPGLDCVIDKSAEIPKVNSGRQATKFDPNTDEDQDYLEIGPTVSSCADHPFINPTDM